MREDRTVKVCALAALLAIAGCSAATAPDQGGSSQSAVASGDDGKGDGDPGNGDAGCGGPKPPPPPGPACDATVLGDGSSCIDWGTLEEKALAICASQKLDLVDVSPGQPCPGGATIAKVVCCGPPSPPPPPPPQQCDALLFGDGKTCLDPGTVKQAASESCAKEGLALVALDFDGACPNSGIYAKALCCGGAPEPPPPPPK